MISSKLALILIICKLVEVWIVGKQFWNKHRLETNIEKTEKKSPKFKEPALYEKSESKGMAVSPEFEDDLLEKMEIWVKIIWKAIVKSIESYWD